MPSASGIVNSFVDVSGSAAGSDQAARVRPGFDTESSLKRLLSIRFGPTLGRGGLSLVDVPSSENPRGKMPYCRPDGYPDEEGSGQRRVACHCRYLSVASVIGGIWGRRDAPLSSALSDLRARSGGYELPRKPYTVRAVSRNRADFSAELAPATIILNAFQSDTYDVCLLSTGKLLSNMHRSTPNCSMHHRICPPQR